MASSDIEWALLRGGSIPVDTVASTPKAKELATSLAEADFKSILLSPEARAVFASTPDLFEGLPFSPASADSSAEISSAIRLIVAIALIHSFVQVNWTGPELSFNTLEVLDTTSSNEEDLNNAALPFLTLQGEPAYHLSQQPALFLLGRRLLLSLEGDTQLPSVPAWILRLHLIHLALLDEPVPPPTSVLDSIKALLENPAVKADQDLTAQIHLEQGLLHFRLGTDKHANQEFLSAAKASGLEFELTGALGKKTKYQVAAHSQLVLLAESRARDGEGKEKTSADSEEGGEKLPEALLLNDDTLLEETEFTKVTRDDKSTSRLAHLDPSNQPPLHPLDQALLISFCLSQSNDSPSLGLTSQQMMPFLSRVISHPRNWSVHTTALLLRSRLEAGRSRTVERSCLQLQALIEQMPTSDSEPKERLRYFHQLPLPSKWEMESELAKRFMTVGVIRSALEIFTRLEMWEDAIGCLQKMEREEEAEGIVRDLLAGKKVESELVPTLGRATVSEMRKQKLTAAREGKLWCLLGDLALNVHGAAHDPAAARATSIEHYNKAWEVSEHTSSRSQRSLGSLYMGTQEFEKAISCFQASLNINPLYSRAWFTVGVAYVRMEKWHDARDAFRKQVGVDEDDAEGWNNLAAVYLRLEEEGVAENEAPPVSYENKMLAFRALRQGLRFAYTNWRMWQNYMIVAVDVGELSEAARAMTRVVEILAGSNPEQAIDADVLDKLVDSVTRDDFSLSKDEATKVVPKTSNEGFGLLPIVERLFDVVIFPRVSDNPRVWRTHARLLRWKEDWEGAMEDTLRAWRCGPVADEGVERDLAKWQEAVTELEDLVAVMSVLGPKAKAVQERSEGEKKRKSDWKFQARGLVRTFMGRTKDSFEGEKDWERLQELLDELKRSE
ncbi:hypothetical protein L202_07884 [Cryptococcus amylolentus CBS 6039]|uniref:Uncharacterized protein n=1 Tax=Cryptococcus amylolentus CBS 6039 TaxID=1295533 RepID=A0A1E3HAL4_9TREE|nr:hypothetical protein L202_07884 [Cryptococcus amylolentus CBS 6039]ODN73344.1 hypothetical protein L202_07884 [Cryptococcus amylolentus CBS 6039]